MPAATASTSPSATGTAACNSTDQPSVARRVPNATSTASSRRRSRTCSSSDTSRLAPTSASTAAAPANTPRRRLANCAVAARRLELDDVSRGIDRGRRCGPARPRRRRAGVEPRRRRSPRRRHRVGPEPGVARPPRAACARHAPPGHPCAGRPSTRRRAPAARAERRCTGSPVTKASPSAQSPIAASSRSAAQSPTTVDRRAPRPIGGHADPPRGRRGCAASRSPVEPRAAP